MIFEYATSLQSGLGVYITPCLEVVLNIVTDKHSSDLRFSASHAIPALFEAALDACHSHSAQLSPDLMQQLLELILTKLTEAIQGEINSTARECAVEALRDVLELCYHSGVEQPDGTYVNGVCAPSLEMTIAVMTELLQKCQESVRRRAEKEQAILRNEGLDTEDREGYATELEVEEDLLTTLVETMSEFFKIHRQALMPFIDQHVAPHFAPYLSSTQPKALQVISVCLVDDIIEYGGPEACQKYIPHCLPIFLKNTSLKSSAHTSGLRQCSVYGLAQALRMAPEICLTQLNQILPALVGLVTAAAERDEDDEEGDNEGITENAVFGLGFLLTTPLYRTHLPSADLFQILNLWLESLPLTADPVEAKISLSQLCDLLEHAGEQQELCAVVMGLQYEHLPNLLRIFAVVFESEQTVNEEGKPHPHTSQRLKIIFEQWKHSEISGVMERALVELTSEQQQVLLR
jgi:hypothetical protein